MRTARKQGESGFYHVMVRGVGQQIIFEDDSDRERYLDSLSQIIAEEGGELVAWCLMDNHAHALVCADIQALSSAMRRTGSGYALYFNLTHGRSGHLFQGRYKSEPVDSDEHLMTVIRYIHQNPQRAGIAADCSYRWSSYNDYVAGRLKPRSADILAIFGGIDQFVLFHQNLDTREPSSQGRTRLSEQAVREAAEMALDVPIERVAALPRAERDEAIIQLKKAGLSARQIQRLTGVSLGVIGRAK